MNRRQNLSCLPGQPGYRAHMKRPLEIFEIGVFALLEILCQL